MKTNPLSKLVLLFGVIFLLFSSRNSSAQSKDHENRYIIIYVPATYQKNNTAYISQPLYYTTYDKCRNHYDFTANAKRAFSNYLKVNHNEVFPNGTQNFMEVSYQEHSTSKYLKTKQQADSRLDALKAEIIGQNNSSGQNKFINTNFNYGCD